MKFQKIDRGARKRRAARGEDEQRSHASASSGPAARPDAKRVNPLYYVLLSSLFSVLLFGLFLVSDRGFLDARRQRLQLASLHAEVSALASENERLDQQVQALKTDPRAVEKIAREDLQLVKPGEIVLILPSGWSERVRPTSPPPSRPGLSSDSAAGPSMTATATTTATVSTEPQEDETAGTSRAAGSVPSAGGPSDPAGSRPATSSTAGQ